MYVKSFSATNRQVKFCKEFGFIATVEKVAKNNPRKEDKAGR
jgi:hypothetical protein